MSNEYANAFARGLSAPSTIQANLTKSAANKAARETLQSNAAKSTYDSNLQVLLGDITHTNEEGKEVTGGMFVQESDGTIVLAPDAMKKLEALSDGNREQYSNALLMNDMMGTYHAETPDGQLEKKRNQQVFAPILAKEGVVPYSVEQAAAAGNVDSIALKKQYENGTLRGYVTPALNQEGLLSLLNVFGSDKADDQPQVATREEILTGLQARADKLNADARALMPKRDRAINLAESQSAIELSNIGGGSDQSMIELVNGVFDENVGRGSTNAFLKNLQSLYAANPKYTVASQPASQTDPSIEVDSKEDVMVNTQGVAKTFEQAYPSLQGLDGERLATELQNLKDSGELDNFGDQQKEQIFTDLEEQGIGSIPDLMAKRKEQKVSAQEQYKEILLLNTVAARTDADGKLVLPDGRTPKEAADSMFNEFYTGAPGATLNDLATAQNARRTSIRADQTADTAALTEKRTYYTAMTERLKNQNADLLAWRKQIFEESKYRSETIAKAAKADQDVKIANDLEFKTATQELAESFPEITKILREYATKGDVSNPGFPLGLFRTSSSMADDLEQTEKVRIFQNKLESITKDYFNNDRKGKVGSQHVNAAYEAHMAAAGDNEELRESLQKMWDQDGHNIYVYNFAQAGGFLEHKFMQEEAIGQKIMMSLQNPESMWTTLTGWTGKLISGQAPGEYIADIGRNDLQGAGLLNGIKDTLALVYEGGNPVKIVAIGPDGAELEDSLPLTELVRGQAISGLEYNWMLENLTAIGDTEGKPKKDKKEEPDTKKDSKSKEPLSSTFPIVPNLSNLPAGSGV